MIIAQCSPDLPSLNRVGPQGGGPTPAPCAKYCGCAIPSGSLLANRTGADSLPARQPLSPRPCGSFGLQSLSAIFLIALNVKSQFKTLFFVLGVEVKSTFELPSEERRQGKRAGRPF
ncbi:hypothetical protein [Yersinia mollaretii]|uniref:hypothetical protein n=1 Tax=Yersinia mollaretii TaxID=33060 RepID=UPI0015625D74|nr:hypothetical protein [Yersinia mollaretii]QKJ02057.1 hypothetical protein HRD69_03025 [Yersinia mollaretii ATCC 43969]